MIPSKLDIVFWRGTTFELELISQVKKFIYDPAIHNEISDLKRSHQENLEFYGYNYEYVDFASLYESARLIVTKPWLQAGDEEREPLLILDTEYNDIELTASSVKIGLSSEVTQELEFDSGNYKLKLETSLGKIDCLTFGAVSVQGER